MSTSATTPQEAAPKPDIPISSLQEEAVFTPVSQEQFNEHLQSFRSQKRIQEWTLGLVIGIVLVVFISFVTFIIDAWKFHLETTKEYQKTIEKLKDDNITLKLYNLNNKIDSLQKRTDILFNNKK